MEKQSSETPNASAVADALRHNRDKAQILNVQGYQHLVIGEPETALTFFQQAMLLAPENVVILNNLGNSLVQLGRLDEATDAYTQAIDADPTYPRPYANLALLHQMANDTETAIELYQQYLTLVPDDAA